MSEIRRPEALRLQSGPETAWGANQAWYRSFWKRQAGCGPCSCSNLVWYLAKTREEMRPLFPEAGECRADMLRLMDRMWNYVTPGMKGVNSTAILAEGGVRFGLERNVRLAARVLDIPAEGERPAREEVFTFIESALGDDLPVAFLNLNNGALRNLDNWHWVTLASLDKANGRAGMLDQGRRDTIDLALWFQTTTLGGGFVALEPEA